MCDADVLDLWKDTLDLLGVENPNSPLIAMLGFCTPVSLHDGVLQVTTSMRMGYKHLTRQKVYIEEKLSQAAFEPITFALELVAKSEYETPYIPESVMHNAPSEVPEDEQLKQREEEQFKVIQSRRAKNPLAEKIQAGCSKLTFDRFVRGDENDIAYQAALTVANGINITYNPLFIYGKSGLGKTHLLRAIQNYISENDPSRLCVYRDASTFISDYTEAMRDTERSAARVLRQHYTDIDVLIIDDIQKLAGKAGTISFFFDTFNELISNGKQIILAADRTPAQLGMGKDRFDERVTSRLGAGFITPIQTPSFELKLRLIETFCERILADALAEHIPGLTGDIPEDIKVYMAEKSGNNIRSIEGFCQSCLYASSRAQAHDTQITREEVDTISRDFWSQVNKRVSIEDIQKAVEKYFDIDHTTLIGSKRTAQIMLARHTAIWLCRELCDTTLDAIGEHFGGRTHTTVIHSIERIDSLRTEDKIFYDTVIQLKESILS